MSNTLQWQQLITFAHRWLLTIFSFYYTLMHGKNMRGHSFHTIQKFLHLFACLYVRVFLYTGKIFMRDEWTDFKWKFKNFSRETIFFFNLTNFYTKFCLTLFFFQGNFSWHSIIFFLTLIWTTWRCKNNWVWF